MEPTVAFSPPIAADRPEVATKTAVIYLRVSTADQVQRGLNPLGYSIPGQREVCTAHATRLNATVIREYVEPGKTATTLKRPGLQQLLAELSDLRPDYVIFYDLSRSTRDEFDAFWLLREIKSHGAKLESTQERIDDSAEGMLQFAIMSGVNAFRSRNDGKKVKLGLDRRHREGGYSGPAPLGYLNKQIEIDGRKVPVIEPDPERAHLVQLGFELAAEGDYSLKQITQILNEAGLRSRQTANRPSKPLAISTLHRLLRNQTYLGLVTRKGVTVRGRHEALIERELFDEVQTRLDARLSGSRSRVHEHYLSATLSCRRCGKLLGYGRHRNRHGNYYEYYSCLSRVHEGGTCGAAYARLAKVEQVLEAAHDFVQFSEREIESVRTALKQYIDNKTQAGRELAAQHQARVQALELQQQKLLQLYYQDGISLDAMKAEQARIDQEKIQAERHLQNAGLQVADVMATFDAAVALLEAPRSHWASADPLVRKLLNNALFEKLEIDTDHPEFGTTTPDLIVHAEPDAFITITGALAKDLHQRRQRRKGGLERKNPEPCQTRGSHYVKLAEEEGFEPSRELAPP